MLEYWFLEEIGQTSLGQMLVDKDGKCLKEGVTFEELDKIAYACSDNEFAEKMKKAKTLMSKKLLEN